MVNGTLAQYKAFSKTHLLQTLSHWIQRLVIKITLWRISFEIFSFLKMLGLKGGRSFYFAFGGNMDPAVLKKRRIWVYSKKFAWLEDFEVKFNHEIPFEGCGFASIEESQNQIVPGVILEIPKIDELRMDCFEGCFLLQRYRKGKTKISGTEIFYYYSGRPVEGLKPTTEYLRKILNGYELLLGADSPFIQKLKQMDSIPEMKTKDPPQFLITDYDRLGIIGSRFLKWYDKVCMRYFIFFIFRPSVFQRWLPFHFPEE